MTNDVKVSLTVYRGISTVRRFLTDSANAPYHPSMMYDSRVVVKLLRRWNLTEAADWIESHEHVYRLGLFWGFHVGDFIELSPDKSKRIRVYCSDCLINIDTTPESVGKDCPFCGHKLYEWRGGKRKKGKGNAKTNNG